MIETGRLPARRLHAADRRRRRHSFRLETVRDRASFVFASIGHVLRLGRAGFILAREGVFSGVDAAGLPPEARVAFGLRRIWWRAGAAAWRDRAGHRASSGPPTSSSDRRLATRPDVVGVEVAHELEALAGPDGAVSARCRGRRDRKGFRAAARPSLLPSSASRSRRLRSRRCIAPRSSRAGSRAPVAVKVLRPGIERRFRRDLGDMFFAARMAEKFSPEAQPAQSGRRGRYARALGQDRDGFPAGGGRRRRNSPKTPMATMIFWCPRSIGTAARGKS